MPSLNMIQFKHVLKMGLDSRRRGFAMAGPGKLFSGSNLVFDRRAAKLAKSVHILINALNRDEANSLTEIWYSRHSLKIAIDFIVKFKSKVISPTALLSLYAIDGLMERRRKVVEMARTYRADAVKDTFDSSPGNLHLLQNMFRYDKAKKPRKRHYDKGLKKKQLNT